MFGGERKGTEGSLSHSRGWGGGGSPGEERRGRRYSVNFLTLCLSPELLLSIGGGGGQLTG